MKTILEVAKHVADQTHYPAISSLVGSTGETERLLLSLIQEVGLRMAESYEWPVLNRFFSFSLLAGQAEYPFPGDLLGHLSQTQWDINNTWPIFGPLSPQEWQGIKNGIIPSLPYRRFSVFGAQDGKFILDPVPSVDDAGSVISIGYRSSNWLAPKAWVGGTNLESGDFVFWNGIWYVATTTGSLDATTPPSHAVGTETNGTVDLEVYTDRYDRALSDDDTPLLPARIIARGVLERFMESKKIPFEARFEREIQSTLALQKPSPMVFLSPSRRRVPFFRIKESGHGF